MSVTQIPEIVTGDGIDLAVTLKKNSATFAIASNSPAATVTAAIISGDHSTQYIAGTVQSSGATGADWDNSLVIVAFTAAQTAKITYTGNALLEVQVDDSGKTTFFGTIKIIKGTIP